jgi:predicted ester cyclase
VAHHEGMPPGRESWKQAIQMYRAAFADLHYTIEDLFAADDKVVIRWSASGTDTGGFMGRPPTGRRAGGIGGINIYRVRGGRLVEHWDHWNVAGLMQQLGVLPDGPLPHTDCRAAPRAQQRSSA